MDLSGAAVRAGGATSWSEVQNERIHHYSMGLRVWNSDLVAIASGGTLQTESVAGRVPIDQL
eukprot:94281-Rhodomonas_salina.1